MVMIDSCAICDQPALLHCSVCGRPMCNSCYDKDERLCFVCDEKKKEEAEAKKEEEEEEELNLPYTGSYLGPITTQPTTMQQYIYIRDHECQHHEVPNLCKMNRNRTIEG